MKTVCFGEIMLRLAPEGYLRFVQADSFEAVYGGGEEGVKCYIQKIAAELCDTMQMCGAHSLAEITPDMVRV